MDNFFIHFVICNITIGLFVLILLCMKRIFKHCLTPRMQLVVSKDTPFFLYKSFILRDFTNKKAITP